MIRWTHRVYRAARAGILGRVEIQVAPHQLATVSVSATEAGDYRLVMGSHEIAVRCAWWTPARALTLILQWRTDRDWGLL